MSERTCGCCGKPLSSIVSDFAYRRPLPFFMVPEAERAQRVRHNDDLCVIDGKIFLIRGVMQIPINDRPGEVFGWGFWASVSRNSFERYYALFNEDAENEPPFPGLLAVSLPNYPDLLDAEVTVHLGKSTARPTFRPVTYDHPLFCEYRDGITVQRWHQILVEIETYQKSLVS